MKFRFNAIVFFFGCLTAFLGCNQKDNAQKSQPQKHTIANNKLPTDRVPNGVPSPPGQSSITGNSRQQVKQPRNSQRQVNPTPNKQTRANQTRANQPNTPNNKTQPKKTDSRVYSELVDRKKSPASHIDNSKFKFRQFEKIPVATLSQNTQTPSENYPEDETNSAKQRIALIQFQLGAIDQFKELATYEEPKKSNVISFLEKAIYATLDYDSADFQNFQKLDKELEGLLGQDLMKEDPLFLYYAARISKELGEFNLADERFSASVKMFAKSKYHSRYVFTAHFHFVRLAYKFPSAPFYYTVLENLHGSLIHWLCKDFRAEPQEYRVVWLLLDDYINFREHARLQVHQFGGERAPLDEISQLILDTETVPRWIQYMWMAKERYRAAWFQRGDHPASMTGVTNMQLFQTYSEQSFEFTKKAYEIHPKFPESAALAVSLCGATSLGEDYRDWFKKSVEAQFDYMPAYYKLLHYMRPRWNGTHQEMFDFGMKCFESGRFETDVPLILFRVSKMLQDEKNRPLAFDPDMENKIFEAMEKSAENPARIKNPPSYYTSKYLKSLLVALQMKRGALDRGLKYVNDVNPEDMPPHVQIEALNPVDPRYSHAAIHAISREDSGVKKLLATLGNPAQRTLKAPVLLPKLDKLSKGAPANELFFWSTTKAVLQAEDDFITFKDTKLQFGENGHWGAIASREKTVIDENTVEFRPTDLKIPIRMTHLGRFMGDFEISADLEFLENYGYKFAAGFQLGMTPNNPDFEYDRPLEYRFCFNPSEGYSMVSHTLTTHKWDDMPKFGNKARIKVLCADGNYAMFVNDNMVWRNPLDGKLTGHIGLTTTYFPHGYGRVRFSNVKIRRWPQRGYPERKNFPQHVDYFGKVLKSRPDSSFAHSEVALAYLLMHNPKNAESHIKDALRLSENNETYELLSAIWNAQVGNHAVASPLFKKHLKEYFNPAIWGNTLSKKFHTHKVINKGFGHPDVLLESLFVAGMMFATTEDDSVRDPELAKSFAGMMTKLTQLRQYRVYQIVAAIEAAKGNISRAHQLAKSASRQEMFELDRTIMDKQVQAYENNEVYRWKIE